LEEVIGSFDFDDPPRARHEPLEIARRAESVSLPDEKEGWDLGSRKPETGLRRHGQPDANVCRNARVSGNCPQGHRRAEGEPARYDRKSSPSLAFRERGA